MITGSYFHWLTHVYAFRYLRVIVYIYIGLLYIYKPVICHNMFIIYHLVISHGKWPIEIDGLPINSMVDLSMALPYKKESRNTRDQ